MSWRDMDSQNGILQNVITRLRTTPRLRLLAMLVGFGFLFTVVLPSGNHRPPPPHWGPHPPFPPEEDGGWEFDQWGASGGKDPVQRPPPPTADEQLWTKRAEEVKAEFLYAYHAYEARAFPRDELKPGSKTGVDNYNGWGVSVVDSIDTMLLMGCTEEYERAVSHVAQVDLTKTARDQPIPFFETTIRYLGGFLSAYALTKEPIFLSKADELGQELLPAFETPTGIPVFAVDPKTGALAPRQGKDTLLAEIGTFQLEFRQLAHWTGRAAYHDRSDQMFKLLDRTQNGTTGLWGTVWDTANDLAVGGTADSAYEYIIKAFLQGGKTEPKLRDMFINVVEGIIKNLLYISPTRHLLYVTDVKYGRPSGKLEHLSCFLPGAIALGAKYLDGEPGFSREMKQMWFWAAKGLGRTCLGPDEVMFKAWPKEPTDGLWIKHVERWRQQSGRGGSDAVPPGVKEGKPLRGSFEGKDYSIRLNSYQLRPETVESLYLLYKTTGDAVWRDRVWEIFEAIRKHCKAEEGGYHSVWGVEREEPNQSDDMPSWFLAETLKYMYLAASPKKDLVRLDEWVFNTEAHPLPMIRWRDWEKKRYGIGA
ncbi:hypothetical protein FRC05_005330 [Tulasnella sp. 425]|nr:hypothetical protein FRC05_005330 [Tulasnella sp. 425]